MNEVLATLANADFGPAHDRCTPTTLFRTASQSSNDVFPDLRARARHRGAAAARPHSGPSGSTSPRAASEHKARRLAEPPVKKPVPQRKPPWDATPVRLGQEVFRRATCRAKGVRLGRSAPACPRDDRAAVPPEVAGSGGLTRGDGQKRAINYRPIGIFAEGHRPEPPGEVQTGPCRNHPRPLDHFEARAAPPGKRPSRGRAAPCASIRGPWVAHEDLQRPGMGWAGPEHGTRRAAHPRLSRGLVDQARQGGEPRRTGGRGSWSAAPASSGTTRTTALGGPLGVH